MKYCHNEYRDPQISGSEYIKGEIVYDARYDIYSLGILLKRLFTLYYYPFRYDLFPEEYFADFDDYHEFMFNSVVKT
jgi:hypothetical protein